MSEGDITHEKGNKRNNAFFLIEAPCSNKGAPLTCVLQIFPKINFSRVSQKFIFQIPEKNPSSLIEAPGLQLERIQYSDTGISNQDMKPHSNVRRITIDEPRHNHNPQ